MYYHCAVSKSMPRIEEALELTSTELDGAYKEEETPSESSSGGQEVTIPALLAVICHKTSKMKDNCLLPPGCPSQEENAEVQYAAMEVYLLFSGYNIFVYIIRGFGEYSASVYLNDLTLFSV